MSKISRNDPCPCGSRQKYKKCCEAKKNKPRHFTHISQGAGVATSLTNKILSSIQRVATKDGDKKESKESNTGA